MLPLLGLVSLVAPAIAMGNTIIVVPSQTHPLAATDFYQVLETSDVPAGVVNIVTGDKDALAKVLAEHDDVDAVWYFGSREGVQSRRAGVGVEHEADVGDVARPRLARSRRRRGAGVPARGDAGEEHLGSVRRVSPEH